jgi:hypothetical protein
MQGLEEIIIYATGSILLTVTAGKFVLRELISLVFLYKELKAVIRSDYPGSSTSQVEDNLKRKPHRVSSGKFTNQLHS